MRAASIFGLVLGLFLTAFGYFNEAAIMARLSNIYPMLQTDGIILPNTTQEKLDAIVLSLRSPWQLIEAVGEGLTVMSVFALIWDALRRRRS